MTKQIVTWTALTLLATVALSPSQGHATPVVLDNEVHILADDSSDSYAFYDGYDIQDLFLREAYWRALDAEGIMARVILYGGFAPVPVADQLHIDLQLTAGGQERTFRVTTQDGGNWTGDAPVVEQFFQATESGAGHQGSIQVFIPYADLGARPGQSIQDFRVLSWADGDLRDQSPGGQPVPGTDGQLENSGSSKVLQEQYPLERPQGYTRTRLSTTPDGNVTVQVQNLITVTGQHVLLQIPDQAGWNVQRIDADAKSVEPGEHPEFLIQARPGPDAEPLPLAIETDVGGREIVLLEPTTVKRPTGEAGPTTPASGQDPRPEDKETPLGAWVALAAVAVALLCRRRSACITHTRRR